MDSPTLVEVVAQLAELLQRMGAVEGELADLQQEMAEVEQERNWQQFRDRRAKRWTS